MLLRSLLVVWGSGLAAAFGITDVVNGQGLPRELCRAVQPEAVPGKTDTKVNKVGWVSSRRAVTIERLDRPHASAPWNKSKQVLSTSFDVACTVAELDDDNEIAALYVAGTYATGLTTVEKWTFLYGLNHLPNVNKIILYQGNDVGPITSMALGASDQYLFFVTHNPAKVCRLSTAGLSTITVVADSAAVPALADPGPWRLTRRVHRTEGPKYVLVDVLVTNHRKVQRNEWVLTVNDANDDGTPESVSTFTVAEWNAATMDGASKWVD